MLNLRIGKLPMKKILLIKLKINILRIIFGKKLDKNFVMIMGLLLEKEMKK